jgi:hypothetical protein
VSRNASSSEPATLLAIYIAPKGATPTDMMKPMWEDGEAAMMVHQVDVGIAVGLRR